MRRWSFFLIVSVLVLWMLVGVPVSQAQSTPRLDRADCPGGEPDGAIVTCYLLLVPENWNVANGRIVQLPVMVLHSRSATPSTIPILFPTSGGPGGGSLGMATFFSQRPWLEKRDMILAEQRGTGYATPSLACPELDEALFASFGTVEDWQTERAAELAAAMACRDRLQAASIDLSAYTTAATIQDLEALRTLLGIKQWHVYGVSYGTRLALQLAQAHPETVRTLLLDSLYNPATDSYEAYVPSLAATLDNLFNDCAADAECGAAYPHLRDHFFALVDRATANPLTATIQHPQTGQPFTLHLTGDDLVQGVFNSLRNVSNIPLLPFIIEQLYSGNADVLPPLAQAGFGSLFGSSRGLFYSVECAEEIPFNDMEQQQTIAAAYPGLTRFLPNPVDPAVCAIWPAVANENMNTAVSLTIPTLILAGEYDAITPPTLAQQAQATLPNSYFFQFPTIGHAVLDVNKCANDMAMAFLADPATQPNNACIAEMGAINWVTDADITLTPALYRVGTAVLNPIQPFWLGWLGLTLLLFALALRPAAAALKGRYIDGLALLGLALATTAWATLIGLSYVLTHTTQQLLGFGVPSSFGWTLWLPWITAGLWLIFVALLVNGKALKYGRLLRLLALNCLAFLLWFAWWGFFL